MFRDELREAATLHLMPLVLPIEPECPVGGLMQERRLAVCDRGPEDRCAIGHQPFLWNLAFSRRKSS